MSLPSAIAFTMSRSVTIPTNSSLTSTMTTEPTPSASISRAISPSGALSPAVTIAPATSSDRSIFFLLLFCYRRPGRVGIENQVPELRPEMLDNRAATITDASCNGPLAPLERGDPICTEYFERSSEITFCDW